MVMLVKGALKFCVSIALLLCVFGLKAQSSILVKRLTIEIEAMTLELALAEISRVGNFNLSYNAAEFPLEKTVQIPFSTLTVEEALNLCLGEKVSYKERGSYIVLLPKKDIGKLEYHFSGVVVDSRNGKAVAGATVYEVNRLTAVNTNAQGQFDLRFTEERSNVGLAVAKAGYRDTIIMLNHEGPTSFRLSFHPEEDYLENIAVIAPPIYTYRPVEDLGLVKLMVPEKQRLSLSNVSLYEKRQFQLSLVPVVGTNGRMSGLISNDYSLNVLGGYSRGVQKLEVGGLFNIVTGGLTGAQIGGIGNLIGGSTQGFQLAGCFNLNRGSVDGLQISGLGNVCNDSVSGVQISGLTNLNLGITSALQISGACNISYMGQNQAQVAGLFNLAKQVGGAQVSGALNLAIDTVFGAQVSGLVNYAAMTRGAQVTGGLNMALRETNGAQVGGLINFAPRTRGAQVAGLINVNTDTVSGAQVAGLINLGRYVGGSQVGFINVCDTMLGAPVGFLSFVAKGLHRFTLSSDALMDVNLSFKTGNRKFYNILSIGAQPRWDETLFSFGYGLGAEIPLGDKWYTGPELGVHSLHASDHPDIWVDYLTRFSWNFGYSIVDHLTIYAGPAFDVYTTSEERAQDNPFTERTRIAPMGSFVYKEAHFSYWLSYTVGIKF